MMIADGEDGLILDRELGELAFLLDSCHRAPP